ncbi:hypothetical protein CYMTET_20536, partial [Cymbomonas tetramitiformis]
LCMAASSPATTALAAPKPTRTRTDSTALHGEPVVSHWTGWQFFKAHINRFDSKTRTFTVDFDDGDKTNREQPFDLVYPDRIPEADVVAVGSLVLFPQGEYISNVQNESGRFWHQGIVTRMEESPSGCRLYSGHHTKGKADGKRILKSYEYEFQDLPLKDLRVAGNVLDLLEAYQV